MSLKKVAFLLDKMREIIDYFVFHSVVIAPYLQDFNPDDRFK